jgi:hypothetical protein
MPDFFLNTEPQSLTLALSRFAVEGTPPSEPHNLCNRTDG